MACAVYKASDMLNGESRTANWPPKGTDAGQREEAYTNIPIFLWEFFPIISDPVSKSPQLPSLRATDIPNTALR
jgi:hypothetical protein